MKHLSIAFTFALHSSLFALALHASVPVSWPVDMRRAQPATFEAYKGETLDFEASLTLDGKPFEAPSNYSFFWQTNGMGNLYWEAPCPGGTGVSPVGSGGPGGTGVSPVQSNVLFATWQPSYDVGAKVYNCFIGSPSNNYHTAFQLRLRPSPGANPNALPLPVPVIDFAKVRVLNPPWESGGGGGVNTNAVIDIIHKTVDGAARPLPKYLWLYEADDSYPDAAQEYYRFRDAEKTIGGCSSVRSGGFLSRNFDFPFDSRAEFVVKMSAGQDRFASVGVAQVGTNLTEAIVTSGKPEYSARYKWLPGATVDGINDRGVACNINVVDGPPQWGGGVSPALHPLAAVRWILDNATNAEHAATYIAAHIAFPQGWAQNFHYMVCDESSTYIVENGTAYPVSGTGVSPVHALTNFRLYPTPSDGEGQERYVALTNGANITSQWWTLTYTQTGYRPSDLPGITGEDLTQLFNYWASKPREAHRGETFGGQPWWQSVHTSVYDLVKRTLRVAVQEIPDWYVFQVPSAGGTDEEKVREIASEVVAPVAAEVRQKIGGDEVPDHESDPTVPDWAKDDYPPLETDPTVPDWAKVETPPWMDDGTGSPMFNGNVGGLAYGGIGSPFGSPCIKFDELAGMFFVSYYGMDPFFIEPAPDISGKADRAELTAATNEVIHVIKDAAKNLKYTITGDNGRFYMTPIGAINPED